MMLILMYIFQCASITKKQKIRTQNVNLDEGNAFMGDVNSILCILMCGYCKTTKDYILKC